MLKEDIIMRGKQLGFPRLSKKSHDNQATMIATIVQEAIEAEREACANLCEDQTQEYYSDGSKRAMNYQCADAIRARRDEVTYGEPTSRGENK